jgi:hypothetical protein
VASLVDKTPIPCTVTERRFPFVPGLTFVRGIGGKPLVPETVLLARLLEIASAGSGTAKSVHWMRGRIQCRETAMALIGFCVIGRDPS